jgi:chromate reductase
MNQTSLLTPRILAFSGSARRDSFNQKLVHEAAQGAEQVGAEVTIVNLGDYPLPIMDEDLEREQGTPGNAAKLKALFLAHDGLLIAAPEYNSSITPLLKNAIDWVSRPAEGEEPLAAYQGKTAALMSASPGGLGGLRGLTHLRSILGNIGVLVLPGQIAISQAHEAFDAAGILKDERKRSRVQEFGKTLAETIAKLSA